MSMTRAEINRRYKARKRGEQVEPARERLVAKPGQQFGRLTVVRELGGRPRRIECVCECGAVTTPCVTDVVRGKTRSCGCLHDEVAGERGRLTIQATRSPESLAKIRAAKQTPEFRAKLSAAKQVHGLRSHPLYATWVSMLHRCENPKRRHEYPNYGGRGISVCAEWHDPASFLAWIDANLGPRPEGYTLDRIDNDGNYEPGNVRWATRAEQNANRRGSAPRTEDDETAA